MIIYGQFTAICVFIKSIIAVSFLNMNYHKYPTNFHKYIC